PGQPLKNPVSTHRFERRFMHFISKLHLKPPGGRLARAGKRLAVAGLTAAVVAAGLVIGSGGSGPADASGNGAPSGSHYNLNIIGVANPKTADMTGANGHTI